MTIKPWKVLETNYLQHSVRVDKCELPNGQIVEPVILEYGTWVNVLALTEEKEAVLIKQYRHGIRRVIWELPGGVVEPDENPFEGAKRELLEETGYASDVLIETGKIYPNPASHTNVHYSFLALDAKKVSQQNLDLTEEIDVFMFPLDRVIDMAKAGDLAQSLHLTTLFFALAYLKRIS